MMGVVMSIEKVQKEFKMLSQYVFFDEEQYLREQTKSKRHFNIFIQETEILLETSLTMDEQYCIFSFLGYSYRILNNPTEGIKYFQKCLTISQHEPRKQIITMIRLGEAYKYANLHKKALELLDDAINISNVYQIEDYKHYIYQHKGKCFLELGDVTLAKDNLHDALSIREKIENDALIYSTRQVIDFIGRNSNLVQNEREK